MIGGIIVLVGSFYYLSKKNTIEGWLMVIGSALSFITQILFNYLIPWLMNSLDWSAESMSSFYSIMGIGSTLIYLIFAVGFFMLIQKTLKEDEKTEKKDEFLQRF
jgi:ABC-type multidrug transport system fused ATPase/permease subunit